jgi:hypothetical protein
MTTRTFRFHTLLAGVASVSFLASTSHAQPAPAPGAAPPTAAPTVPTNPTAPAVTPTPAPAPAEIAPPTAGGSVTPPPAATTTTPAATVTAPAVADGPSPAAADADAAAQAEAVALEQQFADKAVDDDDGASVDLYGFADFGVGYSFSDFHAGAPYDSFSIGNLNLYLASKLGDSWQSLAEVRFSYLPHGNTPFALGSTRTDTTVSDYTDIGRPTRWGGIMIERAYLEYLAHPLLNIRAGHFLTPYGIWNVDHGSPVIIGTRPPFIVAENVLPKSQTGLEIYGTYHLDPVKLGYHLTLSNGRGPVDTYQDFNNNKAVGGRLFARADTPAGSFTLGVSGYTGRYTDRTQQFVPGSALSWPIVVDYNERSLAADLKWEWSGLLLQSELLMNDVVYDEQRRVDPFVTAGPPGFLPDYRRYGGYALLGYRFEFGGIMPFVGGEFYETGAIDPGLAGIDSAAFLGGLNVRPTARVVLKAQYTYSWFFPETPNPFLEDSHYNSIDLQASWSF